MIKVSNTFRLPKNRDRYEPKPENSLSCNICGDDTEFENGLCFNCICDIQEGASERIIEAVKNYRSNPKDHDIDDILISVSMHTRISVDVIKYATTRKREVVEARQIAQYIARNNKCGSLAFIGREIGCKDHATVLSSIKTVKNLLNDKAFRKKYIDLIKYYE